MERRSGSTKPLTAPSYDPEGSPVTTSSRGAIFSRLGFWRGAPTDAFRLTMSHSQSAIRDEVRRDSSKFQAPNLEHKQSIASLTKVERN